MRWLKELDFFRKVPQEHCEGARESPVVTVVNGATFFFVCLLAFNELSAYLTPVSLQRFDIDRSETAINEGIPKKMRVMLNITVRDFPCIDLSLDYQDVMGTRAVDVKNTVLKQRLHPNGSAVGEASKNDPKNAIAGGPANPSVSRNITGNSTCGHCYGARPDDECCNTCSDVLTAYRIKRWALPRIEDIEQCKSDGNGKSAYQPPQIIRLRDYSADEYLPKFSTFDSEAPKGEPRLATPFKLNLTFQPLPAFRNFSWGGGHLFEPIDLKNWSFKSNRFFESSLDDYDNFDDYSSSKARDKSNKAWPDCILRNSVIHGYDIGEALMVDLTAYNASSGCFNNDCKKTDKFNCNSMDVCAEVCAAVDGCNWWTHGPEDGKKKCWIRTGKHSREKRFGFNSGATQCKPGSNATNTSGTNESATLGRRLMFDDDDDWDIWGSRGRSSSYLPIFDYDTRENRQRKEQSGESCQIHGYFDTNKVPGNFHIGTHGFATPSYFSYLDEPSPKLKNMQHVIHRLAFVEIHENASLTPKQPLDGFDSPKAFTFQYYITITPATVQERGRFDRHGYQFRSGSYVTNELIGPAVFFRLDIDPIRVTYFMKEKRLSSFLVSLCAVLGGCISLSSMLVRMLESALRASHAE
jgi:hypothetical protein